MKIGFIGCGNMGGALLKAAVAAGYQQKFWHRTVILRVQLHLVCSLLPMLKLRNVQIISF